ncbi:Trm112 family protein [Chenggangzhangella methanolivorans]|uniref:Trm112 family protein n=1 Tax=Chenggangzhangella methanolivorans TaxID=1437009 RepID=A0A9E6R7N6_9HYPH|nr:Trm112 family protein [Chenggangzhangella methanolivorans]QZN98799.1 Trm112 family protein [Chenggangzhangella methanolivorans]
MQHQTGCPYCHGPLAEGALSCRSCGRDLVPVLPLLTRLSALEARLAKLEDGALARPLALAPPPAAEAATDETPPLPAAWRRYEALAVGFAALLAAYAAVVFWLDLPLAYLRLASIIIPFAAGVVYFGVRPRLRWFDVAIAASFAVASVATMNAALAWVDGVPIAPQGVVAWRETVFYALSIGASMLTGLLVGVLRAALRARGLTSIPRLRDSLLSGNGKTPLDTLKAIELTILMVSAVISAVTGLAAGFMGLIQ